MENRRDFRYCCFYPLGLFFLGYFYLNPKITPLLGALLGSGRMDLELSQEKSWSLSSSPIFGLELMEFGSFSRWSCGIFGIQQSLLGLGALGIPWEALPPSGKQ